MILPESRPQPEDFLSCVPLDPCKNNIERLQSKISPQLNYLAAYFPSLINFAEWLPLQRGQGSFVLFRVIISLLPQLQGHHQLPPLLIAITNAEI